MLDAVCPSCDHRFQLDAAEPDPNQRGPVRPFGPGAVVVCPAAGCHKVLKAVAVEPRLDLDEPRPAVLTFEEVFDRDFIASPLIQQMIAAAAEVAGPPPEPEPVPDPTAGMVFFYEDGVGTIEAGPLGDLSIVDADRDMARLLLETLFPIVDRIAEAVVAAGNERFLLDPDGYEWFIAPHDDGFEVGYQDVYGQWPWESIPARATLTEDWRPNPDMPVVELGYDTADIPGLIENPRTVTNVFDD